MHGKAKQIKPLLFLIMSLYGLLLYGHVSQGLGTTEFMNLIG